MYQICNTSVKDSVNQLESVASPVVAQQAYALQSPMPVRQPGGTGGDSDMEQLREEKRKLEERLQEVSNYGHFLVINNSQLQLQCVATIMCKVDLKTNKFYKFKL